MRERALGKDHADVAQSCNNLAELYRALGRYDEADALHRRALEIREQRFGPDHPEVAQTLNNLGVLYAIQERYRRGGGRSIGGRSRSASPPMATTI